MKYVVSTQPSFTAHLCQPIPISRYPDIPLVLFPYSKLKRILDEFQPDAIHLST